MQRLDTLTPGKLEERRTSVCQFLNQGSYDHKPAAEIDVNGTAAKKLYFEKKLCRSDSLKFCL